MLNFPEKGKEVVKVNNNDFPLAKVNMVSTSISYLTKQKLKIDLKQPSSTRVWKRNIKPRGEYLHPVQTWDRRGQKETTHKIA